MYSRCRFVNTMVLAATVFLAAGPVTAFGQAGTPGAHDHAQTGVTLFKAQKYQEALVLFLTSYSKEKIAEVAWNIGRCYEEMGDLENAVKYFVEFESIADDPAKKDAAQVKITGIRERIEAQRKPEPVPDPVRGELVVAADGDPGEVVLVFVDEQEMHRGALPARILLDPGIHAVRITDVEGYLPVSESVQIQGDGISVVTLKPVPPPIQPQGDGEGSPMAAMGADHRYGDPFLFPSSRTGFGVGLELSPVFRRGDGSAVQMCENRDNSGNVRQRCDPGKVSRPNETWVGISGQIGMGEKAVMTLSVGRRSRVPWNRIHEPFQKAGMELKFRTSVGPKAWSTFVIDMDWAHGSRIISNYEENNFPELTNASDLTASPMRSSHGMSFTFGEAFGFSIADLATLEFFIGLAYTVPDVTWNYGWGRLSHIHIPVAARLSFQLVPGAHVGVESRFPISFGPLGNVSTRIVADLALTYRHAIGNVLVGWAVYTAVNHLDDYGREAAGFIITAEYMF